MRSSVINQEPTSGSKPVLSAEQSPLFCFCLGCLSEHYNAFHFWQPLPSTTDHTICKTSCRNIQLMRTNSWLGDRDLRKAFFWESIC